MPAKTEKQRKFFGVVKSIQEGRATKASPKARAAASSMKKKDVSDFAKKVGSLLRKRVEETRLAARAEKVANSLFAKIAKKKKDMPGFLKQDRPEKVKQIYKALKREHPGMPAETKARIAARQGKPGKQRQGPPYEAPLPKKH